VCNPPWGQVENIQERGKRIASNLANFSLVHESLVEQVRSVLLLPSAVSVFRARDVFAVLCLFLLGGDAGNVETHLDELVSRPGRFLASKLGASKVSICAGIAIGREREVDGDLVLSGKVGVGDFGVRDLEGGTVGDVEGEFGLSKIGLAPVPAAQGVLAIVQVDAVPCLEDFGDAVEVVQLEAVQLHYSVVARENLDFVAAGCAAPLRRDDLRLVAGVRLAVGRLPSKARVGEPGRTGLPREVEVDLVKSLPADISPLRSQTPANRPKKLTFCSCLGVLMQRPLIELQEMMRWRATAGVVCFDLAKALTWQTRQPCFPLSARARDSAYGPTLTVALCMLPRPRSTFSPSPTYQLHLWLPLAGTTEETFPRLRLSGSLGDLDKKQSISYQLSSRSFSTRRV
jgi:hypothetical protein